MMKTATAFTTRQHETDVCIVGGGMSGLAVALAAARHGAHVVLIHDRPMLGGNASSECRVHICGADRHNRIPHLRVMVGDGRSAMIRMPGAAVPVTG